MKKMRIFTTFLLFAALAVPGAVRAGGREARTLESAVEVLDDLSRIPGRCIPPALLQEAQGVAVIPDVVKAGLVLGGRYGRGVLLVRQADGTWSNPIFLSLTGGGVGWQIGVQSTDLVLVFQTRNGLDRVLKGKSKLTLGADLAIAAGPLGRQAEAATDAQLKSEILSYSRSRGLFAGVSLEGAALVIDFDANEALYRVRGGSPQDVLRVQGVPLPAAVVNLQAELARLSSAAPPTVATPAPAVVPPPEAPAPPPPPPQLGPSR